MPDISLDWPSPDNSGLAGDFQFDASGDLLTCDGDVETRQRIVRRFLTNPRQVSAADGLILPPDYIFDVQYGVGLRRTIGAAVNAARVESIKQSCRDAMLQEEGVASSPAPDVVVQKANNAIAVAGTFYGASSKRAIATPRVTLG